jgi:GDP-L-fucose synthase
VHLIGLHNPPDWVNVGTGIDSTILEVAELVAKTVGYQGRIETDPHRPDGTPIKCTDVTRLHRLGWQHRVDLATGLKRTYQSFLSETGAGQLRSV